MLVDQLLWHFFCFFNIPPSCQMIFNVVCITTSTLHQGSWWNWNTVMIMKTIMCVSARECENGKNGWKTDAIKTRFKPRRSFEWLSRLGSIFYFQFCWKRNLFAVVLATTEVHVNLWSWCYAVCFLQKSHDFPFWTHVDCWASLARRLDSLTVISLYNFKSHNDS